MKRVVEVTPAQAARWLAKSTSLPHQKGEPRRSPLPAKLREFRRAVERGEWEPTMHHEAILIERGLMKGGNHRLTLIVELNRPLLMVVDDDGSIP